jgi:beta-N-acetylhexosaminidase
LNEPNNFYNKELQNTSLREKIGQMILVGFRGLHIDDSDFIKRDIIETGIGGVILFDYDVLLQKSQRNIASSQQVRSLIGELQELTTIPLFISIDQEGGDVNRLKPEYGFPDSFSHKKLGEIDETDITFEQADIIASTLSSLGINLNFAPVVDLNINPENPVIGGKKRCFSEDPLSVTNHATAFIQAHRKNNIISTIKHFPGHGSSKDDTHLGMADVTDTWQEEELIPYRNLVHRRLCDMVMTTHIFNAKLDSEYPATLSHTIQTGILREKLGYKGVLISDDLQMKAISDYYSMEETIRLVINAGVDILTFGNNTAYEPEKTSEIAEIIYHLVENNQVSESRINESYQRIIKLKQRFKLI